MQHFSYYTLLTAERILADAGLRVIDVEELQTHGGSLRLFAAHRADPRPVEPAVSALRERERSAGYHELAGYDGFAERVAATKRDLLEFLIDARRSGARVAAYGAPGKGNTLLNYCGIRTDLLEFAVDRNPYKHGRFTPGTHIPIFGPERIRDTPPSVGELSEAILAGRLRFDDIAVDNVSMDRFKMIQVQDWVALAGQGRIADREHERLGRSDRAIILLRRLWERELRAVAEGRAVTRWQRPGLAEVAFGGS